MEPTATTTAPRVFLSYARHDQATAQQIGHALQQAGMEVWWDTLIEGGAAFAKSIEAALESADAVVVLWSAQAISSDWVLDEAARGRERQVLVPISLDGTAAPLGFRQYQIIDFSRFSGVATDPSLERLLQAIRSISRKSAEAPTRPVPAHRPSPSLTPTIDAQRRRLLWAGVASGIAAIGGAAAWRLWPSMHAPAVAGNSVAVLPFKNLSNDAAQAYFSDGLSEEVRCTLSRNLALQVMAKSSSSHFQREQDAVSIASGLGVAYLLDGTVQRAGNAVKVTASLIEGRTGIQRWSNTFERELTDVFAVQSEIAIAVAEKLSAFVTGVGEPKTALASVGGTSNALAVDAYLRGRALYDEGGSEATDREALAQFDRALTADPDFAAAHSARARSLSALASQYSKGEAMQALIGEAISAAERAIELAPAYADAHSVLGVTLFQGRLDAAAARGPYERSLQLGSGEATVLARFAQFSARCGRHEAATDAMAGALARDPLNPLMHRVAGGVAYAARRFGDAIPLLEKSLAMNAGLSRSNAEIGDALVQLDRIDEARVAYEREPVPDVRLTGLAICAHRQGRSDEAQALQVRLVDELGDRVLYQQAQVHAQAGDSEAAFAALMRARSYGDSGLIYARNDPFLDPLRADPRLKQLLLGMGFEVPSSSA